MQTVGGLDALETSNTSGAWSLYSTNEKDILECLMTVHRKRDCVFERQEDRPVNRLWQVWFTFHLSAGGSPVLGNREMQFACSEEPDGNDNHEPDETVRDPRGFSRNSFRSRIRISWPN